MPMHFLQQANIPTAWYYQQALLLQINPGDCKKLYQQENDPKYSGRAGIKSRPKFTWNYVAKLGIYVGKKGLCPV